MALNAKGQFQQLRAFLDEDYISDKGFEDVLIIKDEALFTDEAGVETLELSFPFVGDAFAVNLDMTIMKKEDGTESKRPFSPPLFRYLNDNAKPWSKKCDYIIFHQVTDDIYVYCIELKSKGINAETITAQLSAGSNWVRSLKKVIEHYTGHEIPLKIQKFVFSSNPNPAPYLLPDQKYLERDPTIRLYQYLELEDMSLADLENNCIDTI